MKSLPGYSSQADFLIRAPKYALVLFLLVNIQGYTGAAGASQKDLINEANVTKVCRSQGGRFPPYALQGKEPRRIRGSETLSLCRAYKWKTCCGKEQTDAALVWLRKLATSGEAEPECLALWEVVECSICDPDVGSSEGPPVICHSLCNRLFEACREAFFTLDTITQDLVPCGRHDLVCTRASEWVSSGAHFCQLAGYRTADDPDDVTPGGAPVCFDGKRIPPPGGREEGRRDRKKDGSGLWDAAKKVHKKAEGELEGASGLGFSVLLTGAVLLMWAARNYGRFLNIEKLTSFLVGRKDPVELRTVQGMLEQVRNKQQTQYTQELRTSLGIKRKKP